MRAFADDLENGKYKYSKESGISKKYDE
jgi:hypothetical protein